MNFRSDSKQEDFLMLLELHKFMNEKSWKDREWFK